MIPKGSRYAKVQTLVHTEEDGTRVQYYARRFLPQPETYAARGFAQTLANERTDLLAWRTLKDPLAFWRIADANGVLADEELVAEPGTTIKIPQDGT